MSKAAIARHAKRMVAAVAAKAAARASRTAAYNEDEEYDDLTLCFRPAEVTVCQTVKDGAEAISARIEREIGTVIYSRGAKKRKASQTAAWRRQHIEDACELLEQAALAFSLAFLSEQKLSRTDYWSGRENVKVSISRGPIEKTD